MITILIGHRGAGKTSLLRRIQSYVPHATTVDLDEVIEKAEGPINDIFSRQGEKKFRELEKKYFEQILASEKQKPLYISIGAGFEGDFPQDVRVLWVRRETDKYGHIIPGRPRLNPQASELATYRERFLSREDRYRSESHEILTIPEGFNRPNNEEKNFFSHQLKNVGGMITILPNQKLDQQWLNDRLQFGIDAFELRDDLLTSEQKEWLLKHVPEGKLHFPESVHDLHHRDEGETLSDVLAHLEATNNAKKPLKLAVKIHSFQELLEGDEWMQKDPHNRSFLPRSDDGRWQWYRLLRYQMKLNFIREDEWSALDQPLLLDWVRRPPHAKIFAAVLGDPVAHSFTPAEHSEFFASKEIPVFRIRMTENDWKSGALDILQKFGLRYAAVTSPLKYKAAMLCRGARPCAPTFSSINTIMWNDVTQEWLGINTDYLGFEVLISDIRDKKNIVVWGGGSLLPMLQHFLPDASFYSSRTGKLKQGTHLEKPDVILWATGHEGSHPPLSWKPKHVVDLHYHDFSPGLDYAERIGAAYISGMTMFKKQAEGQREFWREYAR